MNIRKNFIFIIVGVVLGAGAILIIPKVIAHEGNDDSNLVHGCVSSLTQGLRVVDVATDCGALETPIHFPASLAQLPPFVCGACVITGIDVLKNKDLTGAWLAGSDIDGADFEGTILKNASLKAVTAMGANFVGSDLSGVNFEDAGLYGATGLTTTNLVGASWSNTLCPDGTNSDNNGDTCIGHLTP